MSNHVTMKNDLLVCLHCGETYQVIQGQGTSFDVFIGAMNGFSKTHRGCVETPTSPKNVVPKTPQEWFNGYDTGISSLTLYSVMTGRHVERTDAPYDNGDLGRCIRFLKLFPEYRARLPEVATKFPLWKGLVDHWDELETLYNTQTEAAQKKLYERIKALR